MGDCTTWLRDGGGFCRAQLQAYAPVASSLPSSLAFTLHSRARERHPSSSAPSLLLCPAWISAQKPAQPPPALAAAAGFDPSSLCSGGRTRGLRPSRPVLATHSSQAFTNWRPATSLATRRRGCSFIGHPTSRVCSAREKGGGGGGGGTESSHPS
eukprot:362104-Chlamydomonas_euryale.AAC.9